MKTNMDYELAKKLKDAGFDQEPGGDSSWQGSVLIPTLPQLIEACGSAFRRLTLHHNKVIKPNHILKYGEGAKWQANPNQHVSKVDSQWGKTPEIAVAKLWLKLK